MTRFITVPADVTPLLFSGLELEVWRLAEELDQAFDTREENHGWFEVPLESLGRTRELLRVIDWPKDHPPTEATVEIDTWRDILLGALQAELKTQRDHCDAPMNGPELRDEARRAIAIIEGFLAGLPALEADEAAYQETAERGIVLQVLRDDHDEQWSRSELEAELHDMETYTVAEALDTLRDEGAVHVSGDLVWASRCARHLDELGMVSI
jgi:hypothetical protein